MLSIVTFPVLPLTGFTFLSSFGLLECVVMSLISMPVIKVLLPNFSNSAIGIINFERPSPNFIADTMNWFLNLPRVPFVKFCQFIYLVISHLVLRAGCGI